MSYAIVHMQKIKSAGVKGMQIHNNREKESKSNKDIDYSKTKDNQHLLHQENYNQYVKDIINTFATKTKTVRKDAVVMCNFVITSDHEKMLSMSKAERDNFFQDSFDFFADRYGIENIVNATVHNDEYTPHMHLGLVPITDDERLSAKKLFDRTELRNLQTDFSKNVGAKYGLERGLEGSKNKHLSEVDFKIKTRTEQIEKLAEKENEINKNIANSENSLKTLSECRKTLLGDLDDININQDDIKALKPRKTLLGDIKGITLNDIEKLKTKANIGVKHGIENRILKEKMAQLMIENEKLKKQVPSIQEKMEKLREKQNLKDEIRDLKNEIEDLRDFIAYVPKEIFEKIKKVIEKENENEIEDEWEMEM